MVESIRIGVMPIRIVKYVGRRYKAQAAPVIIICLGLIIVMSTIRAYVSPQSNLDPCANRVSGIHCSDGQRTCLIQHALVDAGKISGKSRGAIQFQCDIMKGMQFPPAILGMIRQRAQICSEFDERFTVVIVLDDAERGDLGASLARIEGAVRLCQKSGVMPSAARIVIGDNKFMALWRSVFEQVVTPGEQTCVRDATILAKVDVVPNLAFERQTLLQSGSAAKRDPPRIAVLMPDCSPSSPCQQLDPIVSQLQAVAISFEPLYVDDVAVATLQTVSELSVLIGTRSRLDALVLFLPASAILIEVAFDDELQNLSRYNAFVNYHRIRFSDAASTASQVARIVHEAKILKAANIALPAPVFERRRRQTDPSNPRLAILVPFRESNNNTTQGTGRSDNLARFSAHMTTFLTAAGRDFEIVVIEQEPGVLFNKAALFNIGYDLVRSDFAYLALHDVDQVPIDARNDYHMPAKPTHLCSASSQYGWGSAYSTMVGGVLLLSIENYEEINGMSNRFWGWGMEDDDLYFRITSAFGDVPKLDPEIGRYQALEHDRVKDLDTTALFAYNRRYLDHVLKNPSVTKTDGLNSVRYRVVSVTASDAGYTKYTVGLDLDWMPAALDQVPDRDPWTK